MSPRGWMKSAAALRGWVTSSAVLGALGLGCGLHPIAARAVSVPRLDHIIVVVMENHSYAEVYALPYTASLIAAGSSCTDARGVTHPSEPNYIALWAASTLGVTNDACPPPGSPYAAENFGHACEAAGLTWRAYSEDLPSAGYTGCSYANYARKHAPWTSFGNLNHANEMSTVELAADEAALTLPHLAFVVPNMCNDTHDCSLATGDAWLASHIPAMLQAAGPRGIVILTYDEDDRSAGNQILTCFVGTPVLQGHVVTRTVTHYTLVRTICDALGLTPFGAAATETPVDDIWATVGVEPRSWGAVKQLYR